MNYQIRSLTDQEIGAEILGLDLKEPAGEPLRYSLNAELAKYHVVVFRDQELTAATRSSSICTPHTMICRKRPSVALRD